MADEFALPPAYDPARAEAAVTLAWERARAFHADAPTSDSTPTYSVVIPPPNVTAPLHLGHALNNSLQDVMVRHHRMRGDATLWMPGTDHAGIATQTVVEKRLLSQGVKRLEMDRDEFVLVTQKWKDEYEQVILDQLQAMGASCDWERTRFTMDDMCSTAVRHAFFEFFRDGLMYRGNRLVNWDPVTRTALADDEVEMQEVPGHMWYLRYPLADGSGHVTVATTRPETMFGDTAVAVNPNDPRAAGLRGKQVVLPIVGRVIPIVEDDYVVMADPDGDAKAQFATGFLKVTPAHDPNDWEIGRRHDLPVVNVFGPDASISDRHGWDDVSDDARAFVGLSREAAQEAVVAWFAEHDLLEETRDYSHSVGHSYRSHVPIEPWLSEQWYLAVTDDRLAGSALRAMEREQRTDDTALAGAADGDGGLHFVPPRYARTFEHWHLNLRDWCVSRQLWWGHRIPVWRRTWTDPAAAAEGGIDAGALAAAVADPGAAIAATSTWTAAGAAHQVRQLGDGGVEEYVCVPPPSTLDRLTRERAIDEPTLVAELEAAGYERDEDVLDTWFSSALWPLATMGWPFPDDFPETVGLLDSYLPTSVLCTAREIITLWVSRMVMFSRYFLDGTLPFDDVCIHPMIQDGHGQKMSKSLGNGVDPRDIIHSHGSDALRFTLVQLATETQDVRLPVDLVCPHTGESFTPEFITTPAGHVVAAPIQTSPSDPSKTMVSPYGVINGVVPTDDQPAARNTSARFDRGRNFANKLWNATRFVVRRLEGASGHPEPVDPATCRPIDRWILTRLAEVTDALASAIDRYEFSEVADRLVDFVWHDVCDTYLEAVKPTVDDDPAQQVVLHAVIDASLRLVHPVCPFVTETLWPHVERGRIGTVAGVELPPSEVLAVARWPRVDASVAAPDVVATIERLDALIGLVRALRAERQVPPKRQVTLHVSPALAELVAAGQGLVETLARVGDVQRGDRPATASVLAFEGEEVGVSGLADEIDVDAERARLQKVLDEKTTHIGRLEDRLANPGYLANAKPELVEKTRELLAEAQADAAAAASALAALG